MDFPVLLSIKFAVKRIEVFVFEINKKKVKLLIKFIAKKLEKVYLLLFPFKNSTKKILIFFSGK